MTTMVKVAELAGVSISTVSHVLNGTRPVNEDTRQRVLDAIKETGYRQDALARSLRRSKTDSIGLIVSDSGEPAFAEMVRGVEQAAAAQGWTLLLANSTEDPECEARAVQALLERRVDGLILARVADSDPGLLTDFGGKGTPLVLLDRLAELPFDQVGVENEGPITEIVHHLVERGHERIMLVAGDTRVATLGERRDAFLRTAPEAGLVPEHQVVVAAEDTATLVAGIREALDGGKQAERPTALIACSTVIAAATLRTVKELGLRIPKDLAVAVFDGFEHPDLFEPSLTTIRQPAFGIGVKAGELLARRIADKGAELAVVRMEPSVEYRSSTERRIR